jgi:prevent-host-death family protein
MSVRVTVGQLQERLNELLDHAVETGEEYIVQRDGEDYAVLVSAREWEQRTRGGDRESPTPAEVREMEHLRAIGKRLDALGPEYRLSAEKQARIEELLEKNKGGLLSRVERRELNTLLREADEIMLRRAEALNQIS